MPPKQETFYTITAARASDLEHFFAGSIAVGAGEQSRIRQREPGRGDGRVTGCEKRAVDEQVRGYAECALTRGSRQRTRGRGCGRGTERKKRVADERARGYAEGRGRGGKQELSGAGAGKILIYD